jgi:plasmid stability protein
MAQLIIRNLEEGVTARLRIRAQRNGRRVEEEIREILSDALRAEDASDIPLLGSRLRKRFAGIGLEEDIPQLRGQTPRAAVLKRW